MRSDWPNRCVVTLTLRGALQLGEEVRDLRITAVREGGAWEPIADGVGERFNAQVHPVRWAIAGETAGRLELDLRADILPDPWVSGGTAAWRVLLRCDAGVWTGSFTGSHTPLRAPTVALHGPAEVRVDAPFTVTGALPEAEPRILDDWRRHRGAGLLGDWTRCGELADGGGTDTPDRVVRAVDHGVRPDSGRDATAGIQAAIDACAAAGGGIVELPAGRLDIACERDDAPLRIRSDRIHLRGAGSGADGTLVYAHRPGRSDRRHQPWRANQSPRLLHIGALPARMLDDEPPPGPVLARIAAPAARGDRHLRLAPGHGLVPGTHLLAQHDPDDLSLGAALTAPSGRRAANWRVPGRAVVAHAVRVIAVDGDRAELDHPLPHAVEPRWSPLLRQQPLLAGCAVSGLRFATAWDSVFEHHRDDVHDNGWDGIRADRVSGLLLRDIVFESVSTAASLKDAFACRIEDCRITGNPGHNGFGLAGSTTRCLLLRLGFGRAMHACNMQGTIAQNALVDCEGDEPSGIDFHGSAGLDTLIDRLTGCVCTGGGSADNVPPRHGPGLVLWNWRTGTFHPYHANRPLTCVADAREMPRFIAVGVHGRRPLHVLDAAGQACGGDIQADWGWVEHLNRRTTPASLWRWQRGPGSASP